MADQPPPDTFFYFAYGSNMLTSRLRKRCSSATAVAVGEISGKSFRFSKLSNDGSYKGNLVGSNNSQLGIIYLIFRYDLANLDKAEGYKGPRSRYQRKKVDIRVIKPLANDRLNAIKNTVITDVFTYIADDAPEDQLDQPSHLPYTWYRDLIQQGALEYNLHSFYDTLSTQPCIEDADFNRPGYADAREALDGLKPQAVVSVNVV